MNFDFPSNIPTISIGRKLTEKLRFGLLEGEILIMERCGEDCRSIFISDISLYLL